MVTSPRYYQKAKKIHRNPGEKNFKHPRTRKKKKLKLTKRSFSLILLYFFYIFSYIIQKVLNLIFCVINKGKILIWRMDKVMLAHAISAPSLLRNLIFGFNDLMLIQCQLRLSTNALKR